MSEFKTKKMVKCGVGEQKKEGKKGKILRSRLKVTKNFRRKKCSSSNIAGNEIPLIGEFVFHARIVERYFRYFPGVYRVEFCLARTRKVSMLEHLAPANLRSRALQTEVELQNQCLQLKKLKTTNSSLQKDLVELRQELDIYCKKTK